MPFKDPERLKQYRKDRLSTDNAQRRERYSKDPDYRATVGERARRGRYRKTYGISVEDYDRMLAAQGGVCAICREAPKQYRLAIDHCHKTKRVRGLLCARCNGALGRFQDRADLFNAAAEYLRNPI